MKKPPTLSVLAALLMTLTAPISLASVLGMEHLTIDFTDEKDAKAKATWSDHQPMAITPKGLGWDATANVSIDGWIQTNPMPLGMSWRPATAVSVDVTLVPNPDGQTVGWQGEEMYVRYSPDAKHWSTWQVLRGDSPEERKKEEEPGNHFRGNLCVPAVEQKEYDAWLWKYAKRDDVPWVSDEDAACRWIVASQPDFFAKHLPFIGYVEFRYEGSFHGGQRIKSFDARLSYCIGGMHSTPKDQAVYKRRMEAGSWSFKAEDDEKKVQQPKKD